MDDRPTNTRQDDDENASAEPRETKTAELIEIYNPLTRLSYVRIGSEWVPKHKMDEPPAEEQ